MAESNDIVLSLGFDQTKADKAIDRLYSSLSRVEKEMAKILEDQKEYDAALEKAQGMAEMEAQVRGKVSKETSAAIDDIINKSSNLSDRYDELTGRATRLKEELREARLDPQAYAEAKEELKQAGKNAEKVKDETIKTTPATKKATSAFSKFSNRVSGLIKRAFIFSVIYKALGKIKELFDGMFKSNKNITDSFAKIKGNLLTAFQPIWDALQPALEALFAWLVKVTAYLAAFTNNIFGKSTEQSQEAAKAMNKQAKAAKEVKKSLAGFDTIQTLDTSEEKVGSGADETKFELPLFELEDAEEKLKTILWYAGAIGGALATWSILDFVNSLLKTKMPLGQIFWLAVAVGGAILFVNAFIDAWKNGISWKNLATMIGAVVIVTFALGFAFKSVTAAMAGLAVGGILIVIAGIADMIKNGVNLKNALTVLTGAVMIFLTAVIKAKNGMTLWKTVWGSLLSVIKGVPALLKTVGTAIKTFFVNINTWSKTTLGSIGMLSLGVAALIGGILMLAQSWDSMSDLARVITIVAALTAAITAAAIAMAVFHASWSMGLAAGGIAAGVALAAGSVIGANSRAPKVPALAQGAVLPPNKPFLATVGDQKNGTSIEAPLSTIEEAVRNVLGERGNNAPVNLSIEVDKKALGKITFDLIEEQNKIFGKSIFGRRV